MWEKFTNISDISDISQNMEANKVGEPSQSNDMRKYCRKCKKAFRSPAKLKTHMEQGVHEEKIEIRYPCTGCVKSWKAHSKLLKHIEDVHGANKKPGEFPCNTCGQRFQTNQNMKRHRKSHEMPSRKPDNSCKICDQPCETPSKLRKHQGRIHKETAAGTKVEGWKCSICDKKCTSATTLESHIKLEHGIAVPSNRPMRQKHKENLRSEAGHDIVNSFVIKQKKVLLLPESEERENISEGFNNSSRLNQLELELDKMLSKLGIQL